MTSIFAYFTAKNGIYFPGAPFILAALLTLLSLIFALRSLAHYIPTKKA